MIIRYDKNKNTTFSNTLTDIYANVSKITFGINKSEKRRVKSTKFVSQILRKEQTCLKY